MAKKSDINSVLQGCSVKQKAVLYCMDYKNKHITGDRNGLTDEEGRTIRQSIKKEELREWSYWIGCFNFYLDYAAVLGITWEGFRGAANKLIGLIDLLNATIQEENNLNLLFESVKNTKEEGAFLENLKAYKLPFGVTAKATENKYIEVDNSKLIDMIKKSINGNFIIFARLAKASVIALEEFETRTKSSSLMYPMMKKVVDAIKSSEIDQDYPKYSMKRLREKEAKGLRISDEERAKAIVPSYEDIDVPQATLDEYLEKAKDLERKNI